MITTAPNPGWSGPQGPETVLGRRRSIETRSAHIALPATFLQENTCLALVSAAAVGYLVFHKSFAYLGLPRANLFVGEIVLTLALFTRGFRRELAAFTRQLREPSPLHLLAWTTVLLSGYGCVLLVRGVRSGEPILTALQTFAFNYYVLALPMGLWAARRNPDALRRLLRWLAWVNGVGGTLFVLFVDRLALTVPGTHNRLNLGNGSVFALIGLLTLGRISRRDWVLLALNGFVLLAVQSRAEWLAFAVALLLWGVLRGNLRKVGAGILLGAAVLVLLTSLHVPLTTAATRGGQLSVSGVAGRLLATVDKNAAVELLPDAASFTASADWRREWWRAIWRDNRTDDRRMLMGRGYGYPINRLATHVEDDVRSPHSVFFFTLAYGGWIGVVLFGLYNLAMTTALWAAYRQTGALFGLLAWIAALGVGLFSNWFEAPFGAFPTYLICGMALAPLIAPKAQESTARPRPQVTPVMPLGATL